MWCLGAAAAHLENSSEKASVVITTFLQAAESLPIAPSAHVPHPGRDFAGRQFATLKAIETDAGLSHKPAAGDGGAGGAAEPNPGMY